MARWPSGSNDRTFPDPTSASPSSPPNPSRSTRGRDMRNYYTCNNCSQSLKLLGFHLPKMPHHFLHKKSWCLIIPLVLHLAGSTRPVAFPGYTHPGSGFKQHYQKRSWALNFSLQSQLNTQQEATLQEPLEFRHAQAW